MEKERVSGIFRDLESPYRTVNQKRLRIGITTGTCAAAAAQAAAAHLLTGIPQTEIPVHTPKGVTAYVPVQCACAEPEKCEYLVVKDSGDDPDVTDGAEVYVSVERQEQEWAPPASAFTDERYPGLWLDGGQGIGRVTRAGLEQDIGCAAINKVPRAMIFEAVGNVAGQAEFRGKLLILVRIPAGEQLAERTFNPMLGIEGGISVLGTSGVLEPMSEKAIVDTIEAQIRQLCAQGETRLLVTPGNYGQGYVSEYLGLNLDKSVKCSNYVGETLDLAAAYGIRELLLVGNIGKLIKLAAGIMNTHSRVADGRGEIMALHTVLQGGTRAMAQKLMSCVTTEEMLGYLEEWGLREAVIAGICEKIQFHVARRAGSGLRVGVMLFSEKYGFLGQTADCGQVYISMMRNLPQGIGKEKSHKADALAVAMDLFAVKNRLTVTDWQIARPLESRIMAGERIGLKVDEELALAVCGEMPEYVLSGETAEACDAGIHISIRQNRDNTGRKNVFPLTLQMVPQMVSVGIGCRKGVRVEQVIRAVEACLEKQHICRKALSEAASIDLKKEEPGILEFCKSFSLPFSTFSAEELWQQPGNFTASEFVSAVTGVDNVCERSAVAASRKGRKDTEQVRLLCGKFVMDGVTVALAIGSGVLSV